MSRIPPISGKRMLKLLLNEGFVLTRVDGSHHMLRHPDGRATTVAIHRNLDIPRPILQRILDQAGLSEDDYLRLRKNV